MDSRVRGNDDENWKAGIVRACRLQEFYPHSFAVAPAARRKISASRTQGDALIAGRKGALDAT